MFRHQNWPYVCICNVLRYLEYVLIYWHVKLLFNFIVKYFFFSFLPFILKAANDCDLEPVAYEFFTQAYILYEEEISVSLIVTWAQSNPVI